MDGENAEPLSRRAEGAERGPGESAGRVPAHPEGQDGRRPAAYTYAYADLASILAGVRPVLAKNGLALIQRLENPSGGGPSIRTELRHADGGAIASSFPLGEWSTMQQLGSSSTYVRRYALCAMLGIAAEEDDDGRQAAAVNPHGTSAGASPPAEESPFQPPDLLERSGAGGSDRCATAEDLRHPHEADRRRHLQRGAVQGADEHELRRRLGERADERPGLGADRALAEGRGAAGLTRRRAANRPSRSQVPREGRGPRHLWQHPSLCATLRLLSGRLAGRNGVRCDLVPGSAPSRAVRGDQR